MAPVLEPDLSRRRQPRFRSLPHGVEVPNRLGGPCRGPRRGSVPGVPLFACLGPRQARKEETVETLERLQLHHLAGELRHPSEQLTRSAAVVQGKVRHAGAHGVSLSNPSANERVARGWACVSSFPVASHTFGSHERTRHLRVRRRYGCSVAPCVRRSRVGKRSSRTSPRTWQRRRQAPTLHPPLFGCPLRGADGSPGASTVSDASETGHPTAMR